ncbi:MAG: hypothetical protein M9954_13305 [Cyclobacteriaceae bacterium]|nr:hypothetical protein [Cyclobacteriaceae bacterium]MCB0500757.1 hypothetical protein [Cyclobacteriaceae bacterium]MCB9236708.1 hypothetical protein [Flammeovirgaceae bacterium]MCO5272629.1 hypothetical protein [Cyclobacteriaceae bacterium]MCW5901987.1 hypothetical protein [Cyclobacteriaceae bacterium]
MGNSGIVHQYFKKETGGAKLFVKLNPVQFQGVELIVHPNGELETTEREFDEGIYEDLEADGFREVSGMEFHLYFSGLAK